MTQCGEPSANAKIKEENCKFSRKPGLAILPLRYGTLTADDLSILPKLELGALGEKVKDKVLKHSKYTVRLLRPGYLYTLEERNGLTWRGYKIIPEGQLFAFKIDEGAPLKDEKFECACCTCFESAAAVTIPKPEEVPNFYLLYAVDPLSQEKLAEYKQNAAKYAGEGKMRVIHPNAFSPSPQAHAIPPAELATRVLEYWLYNLHQAKQDIFKAPYAEALKGQLFPPLAYLGTPPATPAAFSRLGRLRDILTKSNGAGIVLPDPIGITQELNNFRNDAFTRIDRFLAKTDQAGVDNQRKFIIYNKIEEVKEGLASGIIARYDSRSEYLEKNRQKAQTNFDKDIQEAYRKNDLAGAKRYEALKAGSMNWYKIEQINNRENGKREAEYKWKKDYESRLDRKEMNTFIENLNKVKAEAQQVAEQRAKDHMPWLVSAELLNAFDTYDRTYTVPQSHLGLTPDASGFAAQVDLCIFGTDGVKHYDKLLDDWITGLKIDRQNLYYRSYCYNHKTIEQQLQQAFTNVKQLAGPVQDASDIEPLALLGAFNGFIDLMKKMDSAFDEWDRNRWQKPEFASKSLDRHLFFKAAMKTRAVFRRGVGGKLDKFLVASLGGLAIARTGELAKELAKEDLMLKTGKYWTAKRVESLATQHGQRAQDSLSDVLKDARKKARERVSETVEAHYKKKPSTNNFHHNRITIFLGVLESIALGNRLYNFNGDQKAGLEIWASLFAVFNISIELRYNFLKTMRELPEFEEKVGRKGEKLKHPFKSEGAKYINRAADIQRGAWKLASGTMAGVAGGLTAYVDFLSWKEELNKKKPDSVLVAIYFSNMVIGGYTAWQSLKIGFSYTAKLFERAGLVKTAKFISDKLAKRVGLLLFFARLNALGLALTAVELLYLWLKDNELQNWLDACTFRRQKTKRLYEYSPHLIESSITGYDDVDTEHFATLDEELEQLNQAFAELTGQKTAQAETPAFDDDSPGVDEGWWPHTHG